MSLRDVSRESVLAAIAEFDDLGRSAFLEKYGFGPARSYLLVWQERTYDSKAIVGAAHGFEFGRALSAKDFSGGSATVGRLLESLGFEVRTAVDRESGDLSPAGSGATPEIRAVEQAVDIVAGRSGGQRFAVDQASKIAVERHAMTLAHQHYARLGTVVETASTTSWDYEVQIGDELWHVEVKGTTGDGSEVILTPNEVAHARSYPFVALYVVSGIQVQVGDGADRITSGGMVTSLHPWGMEDEALRPIGYRYQVPGRPVAGR